MTRVRGVAPKQWRLKKVVMGNRGLLLINIYYQSIPMIKNTCPTCKYLVEKLHQPIFQKYIIQSLGGMKKTVEN